MFSDFSRAHAIRVMETLANYPCAKLFLYPVNSQCEGLYDYYHIIKRPMDITSIINNLLNGRYKTLLEWKRDVNQIYQNSKTFHGEDSYITLLASQLLKHFNRELNGFFSYDPSIWKGQYKRISKKLEDMIQNEGLKLSSESYQRAIEASQKGHQIYQSISAAESIQKEAQILQIKPKPFSKQKSVVKDDHQVAFNNVVFPNIQPISLNVSSGADDDFVSPPEISDESKNGLHSQNSRFQSFELSASASNSNSSNFNIQLQNPPEPHYTSMFEGIDMLDLPPQMVLSSHTEERPNMNSNITPSIFTEATTASSIAPKKKLPSIFGNVQFDSLPQVFGTSFQQESESNFLNPTESDHQAMMKFKSEAEFNGCRPTIGTSQQQINNFIINNSERKYEPEKVAQKYIPQPILMPLPAISQTRSLTVVGNASSQSSFVRDFDQSSNYSSDYLSNREKVSDEIKKEDSFDNGGYIDVTDYF